MKLFAMQIISVCIAVKSTLVVLFAFVVRFVYKYLWKAQWFGAYISCLQQFMRRTFRIKKQFTANLLLKLKTAWSGLTFRVDKIPHHQFQLQNSSQPFPPALSYTDIFIKALAVARRFTNTSISCDAKETAAHESPPARRQHDEDE